MLYFILHKGVFEEHSEATTSPKCSGMDSSGHLTIWKVQFIIINVIKLYIEIICQTICLQLSDLSPGISLIDNFQIPSFKKCHLELFIVTVHTLWNNSSLEIQMALTPLAFFKALYLICMTAHKYI